MARVPRNKRFSSEAYPDSEEWFKRFLTELNPTVEDLGSALNGGLSSENFRRQVETLTFRTKDTPSATFAGGRLTLKNKINAKVTEVRLARVFPQGTVDWTEGDWTTVTTFFNSWVTTVSGEDPAYKMDASGFTCLRGRAKNGTVSTTTATGKIFTLPQAFWPSTVIVVPVVMNDSGTDLTGQLRVMTTGEVVAYSGMTGGSSDFVSLDGVRFPSAIGTVCAPIGQPMWDTTSDGSTRIVYIPGLRPNTSYELTFVIE